MMPAQSFILLDRDQAAAAASLNDGEADIAPRAIDRPGAGAGLNTNPDADGCAPGEAVPLAGCLVVPARVLDDPDYARFVPVLGRRPRALLDPDTLFLPPQA